MRSASPQKVLLVVACLPLVGALAACETTQETSDRLKIRADRILASRQPVTVKEAHPNVRVVEAESLRAGKRAAVAVTLRNTGNRLLSDLPVAVGIGAGGGQVLVNRGTSFRYFEAHTPVLAPRQETTWVLTLPAKKLPGGSPLVEVGVPADPPIAARALPPLRVTRIASKSGDEDAVEATVSNEGGFPQYDLSVYAWAKREGRYVAAGQKSIGNLGTDKTARVQLELIGDPGKAKVHVSAPPTIFE